MKPLYAFAIAALTLLAARNVERADAQLPNGGPDLPVSMKLDGEPSNARLAKMARAAQPSWRDRTSGVGLTIDTRPIASFDAVEWTPHLQNDADGRSPLLTEIWSGDFDVVVGGSGPAQLFSSEGSSDKPSDFKPTVQTLERDQPITLTTFGGRSSDGALPYFNVFAGNRGAIVAIGWSGDWKAEIVQTANGRVRVRVGMQRASFRLEPHESVRLPAILVMRWDGDLPTAQNKFRRLMLAEFTPQSHPPLELCPIAASPYLKINFNDTTEANLTDFVHRIHDAQLGIDTIWIDAGWNVGGFPEGIGNPDYDPQRFPHGTKPVADLAHSLGFRYLQWFEPERVMVNTRLEREHADWVLKPSNLVPQVAYQTGFRLLDLGNEAARKWTLEYLSQQIRDCNIDIYRQDFNMYPSFFWHTDEPEDRVGIREIRYVEGLYALWDGLHERFPKLIIDNCASGGRRLDFELMRRSVPMWRTDCVWGRPEYPRSAEAMTYGLSFWLPLQGLGTTSPDLRQFAAGMVPAYPMALDFTDRATLDRIRPLVESLKRVRPLLIEDYYALTDYSLDPKAMIAVQFHDPKTDRGVILVSGSSVDLSKLHPKALRSTPYIWTDWASPNQERQVTKEQLRRGGVPSLVPTGTTRDVAVLEYRSAN